MYQFEAELKQNGTMNAMYIEIPFDVKKEFKAERVKVVAHFDKISYRGSIVKMDGCFLIGINQKIRSELNKDFGDFIEVTLEKDDEERIAEIPASLKEALLSNLKAYTVFQTLSYSKQKQFADYINSCKKEETRIERINKSVSLLMDGKSLK